MRIVKKPLVVRVTEQLLTSIQDGEWTDWLPCEKHLASEFGVSRTTLRQALSRLREEGIIVTQQGKNSRIASNFRASFKPAGSNSTVVTLLAPAPFSSLRQHTLLWIDQLRGLLHDAGFSLHFHSSLVPFRSKSAPEVEKVVAQHPSFAWILLWSSRATQLAFADLGVPALVVGETEPDIPLCSASVDNKAIGYHAVGQFTAKGHRSIALVGPKQSTIGNLMIEESFLKSVAAMENRAVRGQVIRAEERETDKLKRALLLSLRQNNPPTGFLFIHPLHMITAYNAFQGAGLAVGEDVSLLSAFADQSFDFLAPKPVYYRMDPAAFAQKLFKLLERLRQGLASESDAFQLVPELVAGESVGPRREAGRR